MAAALPRPAPPGSVVPANARPMAPEPPPILWKPQQVKVGDTALGVERVRCHEPHEALVLVERGTVTAIDEAGRATVALDVRFGAWFDRRQTGVDGTERWCIPRRRVCWEPAGFTDWNGTDRNGGTREFVAASVTRDGEGALPGLVEAAARAACHIAP